MFKPNPKKLKIDQFIGQSQKTVIHPYQKDAADSRWVVKKIFAKDFSELLSVIQGIVLQFNCNHPLVLPVRAYQIETAEPTGYNVYIKLPRMEGDLHILIQKYRAEHNEGTKKEKVLEDIYNIVSGLEYLHSRRITHANIKPSNVLINKEGRIQLADVGSGLSHSLQGPNNSSVKERDNWYRAPEILKGAQQMRKKHFYQADMWSMGMVIAELCLLKRDIVPESFSLEEIENTTNKILLEVEEKYDKHLADIIGSMLSIDAGKRKTASQISKLLEEYLSDMKKPGKESRIMKREPEENILVMIFCLRSNFEKKEQQENINQIHNLQEHGNESPENWHLFMKDLKEKCEGYFQIESEKAFWIKVHKKYNAVIEDEELNLFIKELGDKSNTYKANNLCGIDIGLSCITDEGVRNLTACLSESFQNLEQLDIDLFGCSRITDTGVKHIGLNLAKNFQNLRSLSIKFRPDWRFFTSSSNEISNDGIKNLANNIASNLKNLEALHLSFRCYSSITNEGINQMTAILSKNLQSYQELTLDFYGCQNITNQGVSDLIFNFRQKVNNLRKLRLDFARSQISDEGMHLLASGISQDAVNLQQFDIILSWCKKLSHEGVSQLAVIFTQYCQNVKQMTLGFFGCEGVTKEVKASLKESLKFIESVTIE